MAGTTTAETTKSDSIPAPVVLDLGKHRRKQIKKLRKGDGKLMADINDAIGELRTAGTLTGASQPIVIIVQQKRRKNSNKLFPFV